MMPTELSKKASVLFLWAAALSLLAPRRLRSADAQSAPENALPAQQAAALPAAPSPAALPAPLPKGQEPARPPRRMWALVQTKPEALVLAVSASRAELERELSELNETWNHWELRVERQRYAIQPAPVLYASQDAAPSPSARAKTDG